MNLKDKKVLLMGLGILGGGVATARWLFRMGAELTITDMKDQKFLKPSLEKLKDLPSIKFVLGEHREEDFLNNDIIVVNPDVPTDSKFIRLAKEKGKQIENELSLFYRFCKARNTIGITGTRGKTTVVNWTAHLWGSRIVGNSPENPFLGEGVNLGEEAKIVVEIPSFQLELLGEYADPQDSKLAPHVAIITNLYRDHLNRHKSMEGYARAKANIFKYQDEEDFLILNKDNEWTNFFLEQKPKAKVLLFSKEDEFVFVDKSEFIKKWGEHNLLNLFASILAVKTMGVSEEKIKDLITTLPQIKFRQEIVFDNNILEIYNDTTATSPDGTIAAINRFKSVKNLLLISGGTDRDLEFDKWAEVVDKNIKRENLILLSGSATEKMKKSLGWGSFNEVDTLLDCVSRAVEIVGSLEGKSVILFSPSAKSFEKFKNEFDRGEQFNSIIKDIKI